MRFSLKCNLIQIYMAFSFFFTVQSYLFQNSSDPTPIYYFYWKHEILIPKETCELLKARKIYIITFNSIEDFSIETIYGKE